MISELEAAAVARMRAQVAAIRGALAELRERAGAHGLADLLPDLDRIGQAAGELRDLVDRAQAGDESVAAGHLRHDLYGAVNNMVRYAEIVREDAQALGKADALGEGLAAVRSLALALQEPVDRWTRGGPPRAGGDPAEDRPGPFDERTLGARILVVDDDEASVAYLATRLERLGYEATPATSGADALRRIDENGFDVVLLDIMMPEVGGDQVLRKLREHLAPSALPVIMVTARDLSADVVTSLRDGANDYVTKPLDFPVLLARIETQLSLRRLSALKEEFCAIASHDLRGLLTTMLMVTRVLDRESGAEAAPPGVRESLRTLRACCGQMGGVIEDFLGFDAMEHGRLRLERRDVDLGSLLREAVEAHREYAGVKAIHLDCEIAEPLRVTADPARLGQVVRNLINNAVKFTPASGSVRVLARRENGRTLVEVLDSGGGLTDDDLKRLFRRNARLSSQATGGEAGSGLGLYISKRLVELHGGEIGAENRPGGGSRFWFRI